MAKCTQYLGSAKHAIMQELELWAVLSGATMLLGGCGFITKTVHMSLQASLRDIC